jgi:hypothetical protein
VLVDPHEQKYQCLIDGTSYTWEPLGPSRVEIELQNEAKKRVALLVYPEGEGAPRRSRSVPGSEKQLPIEELGELHIMEAVEDGLSMMYEILCTAVVSVESAKRRATYLRLAG